MQKIQRIRFRMKYFWSTTLGTFWQTFRYFYTNRQNRLRFVYTHFKSCDQSLDKTSFEFSNIFHAMQSCAMNTKSSIIAKLKMKKYALLMSFNHILHTGQFMIR